MKVREQSARRSFELVGFLGTCHGRVARVSLCHTISEKGLINEPAALEIRLPFNPRSGHSKSRYATDRFAPQAVAPQMATLGSADDKSVRKRKHRTKALVLPMLVSGKANSAWLQSQFCHARAIAVGNYCTAFDLNRSATIVVLLIGVTDTGAKRPTRSVN